MPDNKAIIKPTINTLLKIMEKRISPSSFRSSMTNKVCAAIKTKNE